MNDMNCETLQELMPDLLLDAAPVAPGVAQHLGACVDCAAELRDLRATFDLMDAWTAPEPSPFFDTRLHARLREEQAAEHSGLLARFTGWLQGGSRLRPAMAGALGLAMLLGGGSAVTFWTLHPAAPAVSSPTVNDLKIYDNNAQALDQLDMLDDADPGDSPSS